MLGATLNNILTASKPDVRLSGVSCGQAGFAYKHWRVLKRFDSTFGSLIAALSAKMWGFEAMLQSGASLYIAAALLMLLAQIPARNAATVPASDEPPTPVEAPEAAPAV